MEKFVIGVDLGGSNIRVATVNLKGKILTRKVQPVKKENRNVVIEQMIDLIDSLMNGKIKGIGISVPGAVTPSGLVWAPNLPNWNDFPLENILRSRFPSLEVVVKDDRSTAVFGESRFGVAKECKNFVFMIVGTGIGVGLMLDGHIYSGTRGLAGSMGWFIVDSDSHSSGSKYETFEEKAAGLAIKKKYGLNGQTIFNKALEGDVKALEILENIGKEIGIGVANLVAIVDPEMVVIGGGVAKSWKYIKYGIQYSMQKWSHPILKDIPIFCSSLGDDAGILGVSQMVMERMCD